MDLWYSWQIFEEKIEKNTGPTSNICHVLGGRAGPKSGVRLLNCPLAVAPGSVARAPEDGPCLFAKASPRVSSVEGAIG